MKVWRRVPVATVQSLMVESEEAVARSRPQGEKQREVGDLVWPERVYIKSGADEEEDVDEEGIVGSSGMGIAIFGVDCRCVRV